MGSPPKLSRRNRTTFEWSETEGTPPEEIMIFIPDWIKEQKPWKKPQFKWNYNFSPPK